MRDEEGTKDGAADTGNNSKDDAAAATKALIDSAKRQVESLRRSAEEAAARADRSDRVASAALDVARNKVGSEEEPDEETEKVKKIVAKEISSFKEEAGRVLGQDRANLITREARKTEKIFFDSIRKTVPADVQAEVKALMDEHEPHVKTELEAFEDGLAIVLGRREAAKLKAKADAPAETSAGGSRVKDSPPANSLSDQDRRWAKDRLGARNLDTPEVANVFAKPYTPQGRRAISITEWRAGREAAKVAAGGKK